MEINTKFFANNGYIGRREYFINILILSIITSSIIIPYNIWLSTQITSVSEYFNAHDLYFKAPIVLQLLCVLQASLACVVGISNIKRRLNDIFGYENTKVKYIVAALYIFTSFSFFFHSIFSFILAFIIFVINMILMFKKGKITGQLPPDELKKFNWGAFLGTWIWGLVNKVYYPLWMLILWFTPFSLYFAIYCGFKGNRWAWEKTKKEDVMKFSSKQSDQGLIFAVIHLIFLFIFPFVLGIIIFTSMMFYVTKNPQGSEKLEQAIEKLEDFGKSYFDRYEIGEVNKFYIDPDVWRFASFDEKRKLLDFAAQISASDKNDSLQSSDYGNRTSKYRELNKTKIYSTKDNKLLAEFYMDENIDPNNFKEFIKESFKAYRFYK